RIYTPLGRMPQRGVTLSIRSSTSDPQALTAAVTRAIHEIDKDLPIAEVATFDDILSRESSTRRFNAMLFSIFAALALVLAATVCMECYPIQCRNVRMRLAFAWRSAPEGGMCCGCLSGRG